MTTEKDIERKLVNMVEARKGLCLKFTSPGNAGVPDRLVLLPGGIVVFVELKRPKGGRIAPLQQWWRNRLADLGLWSVFVHDDEGIKTLAENLDRLVIEHGL